MVPSTPSPRVPHKTPGCHPTLSADRAPGRVLSTLATVAAIAPAFAALATALPAAAQQPVPVGHVATLATGIEGGSGGLEVGPDGTVYTSDFGQTLSRGPAGTRVYAVSPAGVVRVFAEGFVGASGNTLAQDGRFFQANIAGNTITVVARDGAQSTFAEGFQNPVGIALGEDGTLYVANCGANTIARVSAAGAAPDIVARSGLMRCPNGLVFGPDGDLFASNFMDGRIVRIDPDDGSVEVFAEIPGGNNGHLVWDGEVFYVAARSAHRIYRVDASGGSEPVAGSGGHGQADGPALDATLSYPNDLALSPDGRILYWNDVAAIVEDGGQTLAPTAIRMLRLR